MNVYTLLIVIAMVLAIVALVKPAWPLTPVAVLLVCVALLAGKHLGA